MAKTNEELEAELSALERSTRELVGPLFVQLSEQQQQIESISSLLAATVTELKNRNVIQP
jgi:hypothetical protein